MFKKISILLLVMALVACGGPEEKKAKFFNKGKQLFEKGDYVKAGLEFKNAIQIDPKFAEGYYMLGRTTQRQGDLKGAYTAFVKAVEYDPDLIGAHLELGRMLLLGGRSDDAMEKAAFVLAKKPDDIEALLLKGSVLLAQRKLADAIAVLEGLKPKASDKPELFLLLATAYARGDRPQQAEEALKEGIAAHPEFVPLHLGMARFYGEIMEPDKAESAMRKVIELEPDKIAYKFNLAELYWKEGRQAAAIDTVTEVVDSNPDNERVYQVAARFFMAKNQMKQAARILEVGKEALPESFPLRILLGEVYLNQKNTDKAIEVLESCLKLSKDPVEAGILNAKNALAKVYLMLRQPDIAERYTDEVLEQSPDSVEAHLNKGSIHLTRGEGESAVSEFRLVVSERPAYIPGYLNLASAHILNQETELAVDVLKDAFKVDETSTSVRRMLARIHLHRKDMIAAEGELKKIIDQHPNDLRAQIDLGDFYTARKQLPKAEAVYRSVSEKAPKNPLPYLRLAHINRRKGKPDIALKNLQDGYAANPLSAPLLTALIQTYVSQNRHTDAAEVCNQRIEANPRDVFAYNLLGWVSTEQKNYDLAEESLKKAIEMQPLWLAPHNNLARLYLRQDKKQEAINRLKASIRTNPKDGTGYLTLAMIYEQDRDIQSAMQVYEDALKHNPDFWFASNNLAYLISEATTDPGALKRAYQLAERAIALRPDEPAVLDTLAWVSYQQKDYNRAVGFMEQALERAPDAAILNFHMGMILTKLDRHEEARERLEKALSGGEDFMGRDIAEKTLKELG